MAQHAKPIDITRSFVVVDPNAFPNNQGFTQEEDNPEKLPLILGFEGYNFIPTAYGYKSFFGANSTLEVAALSSRCDRMFLFQLMNYQNILVALCEDGLWVCFPSHPNNTWAQWVVQAVPEAGTYKEWTHCVIENNLYCYREGDSIVHKISPLGTPYNSAIIPSTITFGAPYASATPNVVAGTYDITVAQIVAGVPSSVTTTAGTITLVAGQAFDVTLAGYIGDAILYFTHQTTGVIYKQTVIGLTVAPQNFLALSVKSTDSKAQGLPDPDAFDYITNFTPSFLNMAGQKGIFRANARLGFWDSANSISWSDLFDVTNLTPSVETRAGYAIFSAVRGRIVTILAQGDGFIIYTTKGIVGVRFSNDLSLIWEASTISATAGIAWARAVTTGVTDLEHFAYTNTGIKGIGALNIVSGSHQYEDLLPDIFDLLKEQREPVYLDFLNGRFLFFSLINSNYIYSKTSFVYNTVDSTSVPILLNGGLWDGVSILPETIDGISVTTRLRDELTSNYSPGTSGTSTETSTETSWTTQWTTEWTTQWTEAGAPISGTISETTPGTAFWTFWLMTWWSGTGYYMYPSRTTPMKPYVMDSFRNHVDNTGLDLTSWYSTAEVAALVQGGTYTANTPRPAGSNEIATLGTTSPGMNNVSSAFLGLTDAYLNEFKATQLEEWANFQTIQTATIAALNAAIPYVAPVVQGSTPYASSALAQDQINILVAAGGGTGNSYIVDEPAGELLSGAGTVTNTGTITGIGTYHAAFAMEKVFLGGWTITRRKTRTYSVRLLPNPGTLEVRRAVGASYLQWIALGMGVDTSTPWPTDLIVARGVGVDTAAAMENLLVNLLPFMPATHTYSSGTTNLTWFNPRLEIYPGYPTQFRGFYSYAGTYNSAPVSGEEQSTYGTTTLTTAYVIDYTDTTTLILTANPTITLTSSASATQSNLECGWATQEDTTWTTGWTTVGDDILWTTNWTTSGGSSGTTTWTTTGTDLQEGTISGAVPRITPRFLTTTWEAITIPGIEIERPSFFPLASGITYPGSSFLIDNGSPAPIYPTFSGSLVFDTSLKKWGKNKNSYRTIFDMASINAIDSSINFTYFGVNMAQLSANGVVKIYDSLPADSWIRYGKIGYYRQGVTQIQEVRAGFRNSSTGNLIIDTSMDGRALEPSLQTSYPFSIAADVIGYFSNIGKWHTITVSGQWDLQYLEFRGNSAGRR